MKLKTVIIPLITLGICIAIISKWTHGFKAFTIFSYSLEEASPLNKEFPEIQLINHDSVLVNLNEDPKYKLANFVYLNCPFVCHKINNQLEKVYHSIDTLLVPSQIEFVTISFDLDNDDVERIRNYRNHFKNIPGWEFAIPYGVDEQEFDVFLKNIGVWIYKESKNRIINHSTYIYLISPDNKIVKIFDPEREDNNSIVTEINEWINTGQNIASL